MLVYGDATRACDPRASAEDLAAIAGQPPGLARHAALVAALIDASELVQGLTDDACAERDARTAVGDAGMRVLVALAAAVDASWSSDFVRGDGGPAVAALEQLTARALPPAITARRAEGHAFYALYPEAYLAAARAAPPGPRRVIGIRSIGAGRAAVVAAATGAPLPATVRPRGDPFHRRIDAAPELQEQRKLLARAGGATWLARFVGLGRDGERALARARALRRAGFTPEVAGLCHGFLVERWLAAPPLDLAQLDRQGRRRLVGRVGSYLGVRARALPAAPDRGARRRVACVNCVSSRAPTPQRASS